MDTGSQNEAWKGGWDMTRCMEVLKVTQYQIIAYKFALAHHLLWYLPLGVTRSTAVWSTHIEGDNKHVNEVIHHYCYPDSGYVDDTPDSLWKFS